MRHVKFLACVLLITGVAQAQPVVDIVDLGGGSFDVHVPDLGPGATAWTLAGIVGTTDNNAAFVYTVDPNEGNLLVQDVPVGEGRTDVTFVHLPAEQDARRRFDRRRVPFYTPYYPIGPPTAEPDEIGVYWFDAPGGLTFGAGYIARVVLDVSATGFAGGDVYAVAGDAPDDATILASGSVTSTTDVCTDLSAAAITWTVYAVPEPTTLVLLLAGLACLQRRRI